LRDAARNQSTAGAGMAMAVDQGLISQEDFEAKKKEVLSRL